MSHPFLPSRSATSLVVIDMQEKFGPVVSGFDLVAYNAIKLILGFQLFRLPIMVTEQYPRGLGKTIGPIARQFSPFEPVEKIEFSCLANESFCARLSLLKLETLVLCGVETHVCIYQTALDLLRQGMHVQVVVDAVASRRSLDHHIALRTMEQAGVVLTTTETLLFALCGKAGSDIFKKIQRMIKAEFKGWREPRASVTKDPAVAAPAAAYGSGKAEGTDRGGKSDIEIDVKGQKPTTDDDTAMLEFFEGGAQPQKPQAGHAEVESSSGSCPDLETKLIVIESASDEKRVSQTQNAGTCASGGDHKKEESLLYNGTDGDGDKRPKDMPVV